MSKYSKIIIFNNNINNISINDIFNNYFIDENYITPNNKLFDTINYYKNILCTNQSWNILKYLINDYELLSIINNRNHSISFYKPLSRSFYKLWEILYDNNLFFNHNIHNLNNITHTINIFCMAEAPGGFIDAFSKLFYNKKFDNYHIDAISLINSNSNIPTWFSAYNKFKYNNNINIIDEIDGNLYNLNNILHCNKNNIKYDIITADGGFDFSTDYTNQEQLFYKLFYCEVLTAISLQNINGSFICKIFDFNTIISHKIIYILYLLYDTIKITKPSISRNSNSEKYIIATGFKNISNITLHKFYDILINWDTSINFNFNLPHDFITNINIVNTHFLNKYILCYKQVYKLFKNINNKKYINNIICNQIKKSTSFCKLYNLKINYNSDFIKLDINTIYHKYYCHF